MRIAHRRGRSSVSSVAYGLGLPHHSLTTDSEEYHQCRESVVISNHKKKRARLCDDEKGVAKRISGTANFYILKYDVNDDQPGCFWRRIAVTDRRVHPSDPAFLGADVIAMSAPEYEKMNASCRGHSAMVYENGRWSLFFVWKLGGGSIRRRVIIEKGISNGYIFYMNF